MGSAFDITSTKYYGWYRGLVINNSDPDQAGKCQIQIYPMFQGVTATDLPWAVPAYPIFEGSGDGFGYFAVPKPGTLVYCFFEEGDIYQPVYCFEAPSLTKGIPASALTDYPNRKVWATFSGVQIIVDDQTGEIIMIVPIGSAIDIDGNGDVTILAVRDLVEAADRDMRVTVGRDAITAVTRDDTKTVGRNSSETITGSQTKTIGTVLSPNDSLWTITRDMIWSIGRNLTLTVTAFASLTDRTGQRLCQSGFLQPYAGSSAPSGWLLCYGQSLLRSDYPDLFAVIGTTYGSADGTHFNVPDMRGRSVFGIDNMGGVSANVLTNTYNPNRNTLGGFIGQEAHQLIVSELPTHHHSIQIVNTDTGNGGQITWSSQVTIEGSRNTDDTGGDVAHQNTPTAMMVNWIIKI